METFRVNTEISSNTNKICLKLHPTYFALIASGKKVVEGRLRKPPLIDLRPLDIIRFEENSTNLNNTIQNRQKKYLEAEVTYIKNYKTFREMLKSEQLLRCLPNIETINEGENLYYSFSSYKEEEELYGVLAIGIRLL